MIKNRQNLNILELSEQTPTSYCSKIFPPHSKKNSSFSKENNYNINNIHIQMKKNPKFLNIKSIHNQEKTTTNEETNSKFSNSQNISKKKRPLVKSVSYKNKKKEREKIIKLLRNNLKIKIPSGKRKSNEATDSKLNINNIEQIIKKHNTKERKDSFGNKITKENKKNVHICFKDIEKEKKLIELIPIESFKSLNIIEENKNKETQPYFTKCCSIF